MPSSVITHFTYDLSGEKLEITFVSGTVYNYKGVPAPVYEGLKNSKSKGIYFNRMIKEKYGFERVDK